MLSAGKQSWFRQDCGPSLMSNWFGVGVLSMVQGSVHGRMAGSGCQRGGITWTHALDGVEAAGNKRRDGCMMLVYGAWCETHGDHRHGRGLGQAVRHGAVARRVVSGHRLGYP